MSRIILRWLLVCLLVLPAVSQASLQSEPALKAQPALLERVQAQPEEMVQVIVQKLERSDRLERWVEAHGGRITKDLHIINAFAAEMPAAAVTALASDKGVRWVSLDAPVTSTSAAMGLIDVSRLANAYVQAIGASQLWNEPPYLQGQGITVALVDSGLYNHSDLKETSSCNSTSSLGGILLSSSKGLETIQTAGGNSSYRILANARVNSFTNSSADKYGHGTHVAGIIGGNGSASCGAYVGVAPQVNFVNVKVSDDQGRGMTSDVVAGLQWVYEHKDEYNIRVVNVSINSSVPESYHVSPLDAALEVLWFNRVVVVVSAGNNATNGILYPPANDPFVITVGAADDRGTPDVADDVLASFSAYGITEDGFNKPDIVAPGKHIVSLLASSSALAKDHRDHVVNSNYFWMSGTSMSAAVTSGAVALLLQSEPHLTPDQVKYRLMATARPFPYGNGAGYLDIYAAVHTPTTESANTGTPASRLLWTGPDPVNWNSVNWDSVNWDSVNWDSVNWDSVNWDSVNWDSVNWDD